MGEWAIVNSEWPILSGTSMRSGRRCGSKKAPNSGVLLIREFFWIAESGGKTFTI
jgi:hypothetical protein